MQAQGGRWQGRGVSPACSGSGKHSVTLGGVGVQGLSEGCCPALLAALVLGHEHQFKLQPWCLRFLLTPPGNKASPGSCHTVPNPVAQAVVFAWGYRNWPLLSHGLAEPG